MGERIQLKGGWYEFIEPTEEEIDPPEGQQEFFLPVAAVNQMAVFCRYNNTQVPQ